jgi:hypothetical protein
MRNQLSSGVVYYFDAPVCKQVVTAIGKAAATVFKNQK